MELQILMMKTKFILLFNTLIALLFLSSCQDVIQLDVPNDGKVLVVEGQISDNIDLNYVKLTFTNAYYDTTKNEAVKNAAVVIINQNGDKIYLLETPANSGIYKINSLGVIGNSYLIEITLDNGEFYRSDLQMMDKNPKLDTIYQRFFSKKDALFFMDTGIYVLFGFQDDPTMVNNYWFRFYKNDTLYNSVQNLQVSEDRFYNGSKLEDLFFLETVLPGDKIKIESFSISYPQFEFLTRIVQQVGQQGTPFDVPPAPLKGNVKCISNPNKYTLGFFGVNAVISETITIK